jgi:hypothetical protein
VSFKQPPEISIGVEALNSSDLNKVRKKKKKKGCKRESFVLDSNPILVYQWPGLGPFLRSSIVNAVGTMLVR